jgi:choline/glycine/proline betaine transport protein
VVIASCAAILLITGGIAAIQAIILLCSLPLTIILLLFCFSLWRGLLADRLYFSKDSTMTTLFWSGQNWKKRLQQILHHPTKNSIINFINQTALPAIQAVHAELNKQGINVEVVVSEQENNIYLIATQENHRNFVYGVKSVKFLAKMFVLRDTTMPETKRTYNYEAVTFFEDGRKGYDIQYLSHDEIIKDILKHFERYLDLLHNKHVDLLNAAPGYGVG